MSWTRLSDENPVARLHMLHRTFQWKFEEEATAERTVRVNMFNEIHYWNAWMVSIQIPQARLINADVAVEACIAMTLPTSAHADTYPATWEVLNGNLVPNKGKGTFEVNRNIDGALGAHGRRHGFRLILDLPNVVGGAVRILGEESVVQ